MESRDILKVKDRLKDPTKMFETCWLLGCQTTTQKPGLKDCDLSRARKTELCIQASRQAPVRLCLELHRGSDLWILSSLKTYSSVETEEELEELFNAGMNDGRDKEDEEEAIQQDRKDEGENQTNDTSGKTAEKKDEIKFDCVICKESSDAHKCSVCDQFVHAICGSYSEDRVSDRKSLATSV